MRNRDQWVNLTKIFAVWGAILLLILAMETLRTTSRKADLIAGASGASAFEASQSHQGGAADSLPPSSKKRDYLQTDNWPHGMRLYRDWWSKRQAAIYVVEVDRTARNLRFGVALANDRILGREKISSMAGRLAQRDIPMLAGINGGFGIREDRRGRGGMFFNLHIQDWELVSVPIRRNWWGYSPASPWGETSFGVTTEGEFLIDAVQLNGVIRINGKTLKVGCINQIRDSSCPVVIYTPRFGPTTLTRSGYEVVLKQLDLPLKGRYQSRFVIDAVSMDGDNPIPRDGIILSLDRQLAYEWRSILSQGTEGELDIALSPAKWQRVPDGIGGNIRLLRNGEIEPELVKFNRSGGASAPDQSNGISLHPRSALGFNDDKLFLVTVDGRQMGYSMGMTFYELAEFLRDLGVKQAVNFDGGSSSTLWGLGSVVNRPSNGYERRVFNVAMITTRSDHAQPLRQVGKRKD